MDLLNIIFSSGSLRAGHFHCDLLVDGLRHSFVADRGDHHHNDRD